MQFIKSLLEKEEKKQEKVFVETDPSLAFPDNTISALEKRITKLAKDLNVDWKSSAELCDKAFEELEVPKPMAYQKARWQQYTELLAFAIKKLYDSRGLGASWSKTI